MTDPEVLIPARQGRAVRVARGAAIDVVNTHGTQVVDFWALCSPDTSEHLSMEHTRIAIGRLMPQDVIGLVRYPRGHAPAGR